MQDHNKNEQYVSFGIKIRMGKDVSLINIEVIIHKHTHITIGRTLSNNGHMVTAQQSQVISNDAMISKKVRIMISID